MTTIAVLAAHPDDELLGAGATLAAHTRAGDDVHALVLADGATSRYAEQMVPVLADSAKRAAEVLGLASVRTVGLADQRLDTLALIDVILVVEDFLNDLRPQVVYTHFAGDANLDHAVVARAAWTACRPYAQPQLRRFAAFETPSSTEWGWPLDPVSFAPTVFVDVAATLDVKLAAMACYETELRAYPHPRSLRALTERAAFWGSRVGLAAAEPFQMLRELR